MSVRKRQWKTRLGEYRQAWVIDYTDGQGRRCLETFDTKKEADARHSAVRVRVAEGTHTAPSKSPTVAQAAESWIEHVALERRERTTIEQYKQHRSHIVSRIGRQKIGTLTAPDIHAFRKDLLGSMSRPMARKVLASLKSILKHAQSEGAVAQNVAHGMSVKIDKRDQGRLEVGRDIPTPQEVRAIIDKTEGRARAFLMVAAFAGLRASELRGLRWSDVDLRAGKINVRQRADRYGDIGAPKSHAGTRTIPIGPMVGNTLREWKLKCPKGDLNLVFPTGAGKPENHSNIVQRLWGPTQVAAGVAVPALDDNDKARVNDDGKPIIAPKYTGLHALRHFYASWCINRVAAGGLGLPLKDVQVRMGHSSIIMTADRYGHLFETDDGSELAEAERRLFV